MKDLNLFGMRVIEHNLGPIPKISISPSFKWCSDQCRAEINAYLLEQFGTMQVAYIFDPAALGLYSSNPVIALPPKMAALIRF